MEFKRVCRLSFATMVILLNLLQLICPPGNLLPTTKYQLLKFSRRVNSEHWKIDYCRSCSRKLQTNQKCPSSICEKSEPNSVILIPPKKTLQQIISSKPIHAHLYRHTCMNSANVNLNCTHIHVHTVLM